MVVIGMFGAGMLATGCSGIQYKYDPSSSAGVECSEKCESLHTACNFGNTSAVLDLVTGTPTYGNSTGPCDERRGKCFAQCALRHGGGYFENRGKGMKRVGHDKGEQLDFPQRSKRPVTMTPTTVIQTNDDKWHSGVIHAENDTKVVLRVEGSRLHVIQKKNIKSRQWLGKSKKKTALTVPKTLQEAVGYRVRFKMKESRLVEGELTLFNGIQAKVETAKGPQYVRMTEVINYEILDNSSVPNAKAEPPEKPSEASPTATIPGEMNTAPPPP